MRAVAIGVVGGGVEVGGDGRFVAASAALPGAGDSVLSTPPSQSARLALRMFTLRSTRDCPAALRKLRCARITLESSTSMPTPAPSSPL